jgi:hypothetical protein
LDQDLTAGERKWRSSPWETRRRGPSCSDVDGEVDLVILGGDGVHDGVQEITTKLVARRGPRGNLVTITGGGWRLGRGGEIGGADELIVYREKEGEVTLPGGTE